MSNLVDLLNIKGLDPIDIHHVLLDHFKQARHTDQLTLNYMRQGEAPAITICQSKKGAVTSVSPGASLTSEDIDKIRNVVDTKLRSTGSARVVRAIMFSFFPPKGYFRWKDDFQILPVPPHAPQPQFGMGGYPFLIEAKMDNFIGIPAIDADRRGRIIREATLALQTLLAGRVTVGSNRVSMHWVYQQDESGGLAQYAQSYYSYPGYSTYSETFSDITNLHPMAMVGISKFFSPQAVNLEDSLTLPDTLPYSLEIIDKLSPSDRERFLLAAYWCQTANAVWEISSSSAFVALVSAIEALLPPAPPGHTCEACGIERKLGPTASFQDFIEKYATGDRITKQMRKDLYSVRSKLAHGQQILSIDEVRTMGSVKANSDRSRYYLLKNVIEVAVYNWLHSLI